MKYPALVVEILLISLSKALRWEVLKYEYILIKTSDEILRKNVDGAHLHHKEILHAKFGKIRTVRYSVHAIRASPYRSCSKNYTYLERCVPSQSQYF